MKNIFNFSLSVKILLYGGITLFIVLAISFFMITVRENKQMLEDNILLAESVALVVGKSMNHSMVMGDMEGIQNICLEVGKLETVDNLRVLNENQVIKRSSNLKELETSVREEKVNRVFATGKGEGWIGEYLGETVYREVIPYFNEPHCQECHSDVKSGGVLGVLDVSVCLERMYNFQESNQRKMIFHLLFVGLVVGLIIYFSVQIIISRPIKNLTNMVIDIAKGEGDLTKRLRIETNDELGELANNFNLFMDKLHDIVYNVTQFSNKIASTSSELATSAEEMVNASDSQRSQTDQVATAMEQMSSTVADVARNSGRASDFTKKAVETAKKGGEIVHKTMEEMENINQIVNEASMTITKLGQNSDQIGEIIRVIDEIADQTNLLALNAAIEAARAGEQGRGFAVVADEIRKLAERTTRSTKEIAFMIKTIQGDTQGAVASMEMGTNEVREGVKFSQEAGQALNEIVDIVGQVTQMVNQIAIAAEEQSTATEQISSSVETVASVSSQNARGAHQSSASCENLANLASELQEVVGKFKLRSS